MAPVTLDALLFGVKLVLATGMTAALTGWLVSRLAALFNS